MFFCKLVFPGIAALAGVSAAKFPITNAVTKNTAENKMKSKLMAAAKPLTRKLDEGDDVVIDLTGYSIVFEKCQYVKFYNVGEDDGNDNGEGGILSTNKFVIFKLCNSNSCSTGCNYDYAEYVIDMYTYIEALTEMKQESIENMCNSCQNNCQMDDDAADYSEDCQSCMNECDAYDTLEDNGYGDASQFVECAEAQADDDAAEYSMGAYCSDDGSKITIGVFSDAYCSTINSDLDAATFLGYNGFSDHVLMAAYSTDCISCLQEVEDDGDDAADDYQQPETSETCQALYDAAGKCESPSGFKGGYLDYYSSQASNEDAICSFISSLDSGTYDQTGEIVIGDGGVKTVSGGSSTTGGQKFFLTVLILSTAGLAGYAAMLHQQLTGGGAGGLMGKGGALA